MFLSFGLFLGITFVRRVLTSLPPRPPTPPSLHPSLQVLNRLRQVLRTVVSSHLGEKSAVSYQLSENQYAANEAEDPFAQALVEYLR